MTIPKNLQEKREELAKEWVKGWNPLADETNSVIALNYKKGFKDCADLLLPEIEKMVEALEWYATKGEGVYSDAKLYLRAESALHSWQRFAEGGE